MNIPITVILKMLLTRFSTRRSLMLLLRSASSSRFMCILIIMSRRLFGAAPILMETLGLEILISMLQIGNEVSHTWLLG